MRKTGWATMVCAVMVITVALMNYTAFSRNNNFDAHEDRPFRLDNNSETHKTPFEWSIVRLDYARQDKIKQLKSFCQKMHNLAQRAQQDQFINAFFDINIQYTAAQKSDNCPHKLTEKIKQLRDGLNSYYIQEYFAFYDILFIDYEGNIFYTLRKESDYQHSLKTSTEQDNLLARCIQKSPEAESFVDFHNYGPSHEAAAFFVEPIYIDGKHCGWIALQCAANKLDSLFAWTQDLGKTGETFLVNSQGYMLTESNFEGVSTILKKKLDDRNIQAKFTDGKGHRIVTDYRGCTAISSFEVVPFLDTEWLVVAKMDTDEIVTNHYIQHQKYFGDALLVSLKTHRPQLTKNVKQRQEKTTIRIDMDEFLKADNGEQLETFGISTCTGLLIAYPKKFAYMAHVSPRDKVYGSSQTNLLEQMLKKVNAFDIYPCEKRKLKMVIVAPHLDSTLAIIDKLLDEGFMLSQIKIMHNQQALSARMTYDYMTDKMAVSWRLRDSTELFNMDQQAVNAGDVIARQMLGNNSPFGSEISCGKLNYEVCMSKHKTEENQKN